VCGSSFSVVEPRLCVDLVSLGLCVNIGSCGCVSTLDLVPVLMN
jgi:hypothetical protein